MMGWDSQWFLDEKKKDEVLHGYQKKSEGQTEYKVSDSGGEWDILSREACSCYGS